MSLECLRDYWKKDNQDLGGKPEIKKKVDFEKELDSYKKTLKFENGVGVSRNNLNMNRKI